MSEETMAKYTVADPISEQKPKLGYGPGKYAGPADPPKRSQDTYTDPVYVTKEQVKQIVINYIKGQGMDVCTIKGVKPNGSK